VWERRISLGYHLSRIRPGRCQDKREEEEGKIGYSYQDKAKIDR